MRDRVSRRHLDEADPENFAGDQERAASQQDEIELIAFGNIVSQAVLDVVGTLLMDKMPEVYPGSAITAAVDMSTSS